MSADSPRRSSGITSRGMTAVPAIVPPQIVSDRSILDSAIGFINEVTLSHQPPIDPKDTITWARFETAADISDPCFGDDWELEGHVAPPLLLILGYGLGIQVWAIPANGEAVEVLSWRHGIVSALRVLPTPAATLTVEEHGRADEPVDVFGEKRPLIALVDGSSTPGSQPQFCAVNFVSLKTGAQVKTIKFKNPVIDILANRSSVVVTFHERIAVFDARTLEDRLSITTCYPSPGINPNPAALGPRWLAYAENKLLHSKRSGGGCDGDGVASYTATVLNASKSLVKGLRELGEHVAAGLTGTSGNASSSKNASFDSGSGFEAKQSGIVTIIDIKNPARDYSPNAGGSRSNIQTAGTDSIIAHFIAHSEALVALEFDNSGMLLVTADRRGHDFHVFRIQPSPVGSSLAAVHHLYILHRGDTTAKVQNITLTLDSRWVAVSTLRGTTHVFPITPYGGAMGVRTHTSLHVVNKLSRFHRSAGLSAEGRSNSPITHSESTTFTQSLHPYHNSTLPPYSRPTVVMPLAQLRQPFALGSPQGSATLAGVKSVASGSNSGAQRQRLSSLSDDSGKPLSVCAIFAKSRSWLLDPPNVTREAPHRVQRKAVDSLFVMAGHGALIQYDLDTKLAANVAKEKICDDTPIELEVEAKAQWNLGRRKEGSQEIMPPLSPDNWLIKNRNSCILTDSTRQYDDADDQNESWLSQVEIITHAGPHRRLWMGPQFVFKTYNTPSGSNLSHVDIEAVEIGTSKPSTSATSEGVGHSSPLNMPLNAIGRSSAVPVLIESGSYSSVEQSPKLMNRFHHDHIDSDFSVAHGDSRLKEDLADAMRESPSTASSSRDLGGHGCESTGSSDNVAFYDALTAEDDQVYVDAHLASAAALASVLPNIHSYDNSSSYESLESIKKPKASIEKIVNPLGTVTTVTSCLTADVKTDILDEVVSQLAAEEIIIHENCDESLFRPVVAIFCDKNSLVQSEEEAWNNTEQYQPPEIISSNLVVPVIEKEINDELNKREKEKTCANKSKPNKGKEQKHFEEWSSLNKKPKETIQNVQKTFDLKDSSCACSQSNKENKGKQKSTQSTHSSDCMRKKENCEEKTISLKSSSSLKEESTEINVLLNVCKTSLENLKKESQVQEEKESKKLDGHPADKTDMSDKVSRPKIEQKIDIKSKIDSKEKSVINTASKSGKQDSFDVRKGSDLIEKAISTKEATGITKKKSKALNTYRVEREQKMNNVVQETTANIKFTANFPSKMVQIDPAKNQSDCENSVTSSASDVSIIGSQASNNLIEVNTALKATQAEDDNSSKMKEETSLKADNDNILQKVDSLVGKKAEKCMSKSIRTIDAPSEVKAEIQGSKLTSNKGDKSKITGSLESTRALPETSQIKQNAFNISKNEVSGKEKLTDIKKNNKSKEKVIACKEQDVAKKYEIQSKESELTIGKHLSDESASVSVSSTEFKGKCDKIVSNENVCEKEKSNKLNSPESVKRVKAYCRNDNQIDKSAERDKDKSKKIINNQNQKENSLVSESDPEGRKVAKESNYEEKEKPNKIIISQTTKADSSEVKGKAEEHKKKKQNNNEENTELLSLKGRDPQLKEESAINPKNSPTNDRELDLLMTNNAKDRKETKVTNIAQKPNDTNKDLQKKESREKNIAQESTNINANLERKVSPQKNPEITSANIDQETNYTFKDLHSKVLHVKKQETISTNVNQQSNNTNEEFKRKESYEKNSEVKSVDITQESNTTNKDLLRKELPEKNNKQDIKSVASETKSSALPPTSPKKKGKSISKDEIRKEDSSTKTTAGCLPATIKQNLERKESSNECLVKKEAVKDEKPKPKNTSNKKELMKIPFDICEKASKTVVNKTETPLPPPTSAWKTISGADMINKNLTKSESCSTAFPVLGGANKLNTSDKLLPEVPTPNDLEKQPSFHEFSILSSLDTLAPLPPLEPLQLFSLENKSNSLRDISLINFESPLQENPTLQGKITPFPRGFTEQNLILALCGSLHYENEQEIAFTENKELSPTFSMDRSCTVFEDPSLADYQSLAENDDPYMSFEQSSQDTNTTTTTNTTNEKFSSSTNSSGSEEIMIMEEKKMSRKQKRKRQQHLKELQQQKCEQQQQQEIEIDDEELRPLIAMTESQVEQEIVASDDILPTLIGKCGESQSLTTQQLIHSTTTDSEGPMPATTSDDNVFAIPMPLVHNQQKIKTKKIEHKINLIAAIEAATSSSTSSAEESGVELCGRSARDNDESLVSVSSNLQSTSTIPLPIVATPHAALGVLKKKTKRRKR